jgi:hypothetical protein
MVAVLTFITTAAMATDVTTDFIVTMFPSVIEALCVPVTPFPTMSLSINSVQCFLWLVEGTRNIRPADISYLVQCSIATTKQWRVCLSVWENLIFCVYVTHSYAPVDDLYCSNLLTDLSWPKFSLNWSQSWQSCGHIFHRI